MIPLHLPPLRERREDIPLLAEHFLPRYAGPMGKDVRAISQDAHDLLRAYDWPGNVRELENVIERAVALEQTPTVLPETLPEHIRARRLSAASPAMSAAGMPVAGAPTLPELGAGFDLEAQGKSSTATTSVWRSSVRVACR